MEIMKRYKNKVILCDEDSIAIIWTPILLGMDLDVVGYRYKFRFDFKDDKWEEIRRGDTIVIEVMKEINAERGMDNLLTTTELDMILKYPTGRTARLVRQGKIEAIHLPDGSVRIAESELRRIIERGKGVVNEQPH
jgi:hypothetical protein